MKKLSGEPTLNSKSQLFKIFDALVFLATSNIPEALKLQTFAKTIKGGEGLLKASELIRDADRPPQIAIIGKTGVGKSSTINKLFNPVPNLEVDHIEPTTKSLQIVTLSLGKRGKLVFVDCPGLGESDEADRRNIEAYREVLRQSDVAVWILKVDDKTLGIDSAFIQQVLPDELKSKLVVGINQVDLIYPNDWIKDDDLPSEEQEKNIELKVNFIDKQFRLAGIKPFAVVPYSALRGYRLTKLFRAMVDACSKERVPALVRRSDMDSLISAVKVSTQAVDDNPSNIQRPVT